MCTKNNLNNCMMKVKTFFFKRNYNLYLKILPIFILLVEIIMISGSVGFFEYKIGYQIISIAALSFQVSFFSNYNNPMLYKSFFLHFFIFLNSCFLLYAYCEYWVKTEEKELYFLSAIIFSVVFGYHVSKIFEAKIIKIKLSCLFSNKIRVIMGFSIVSLSLFYLSIKGLFSMNTEFISILSGAFFSAILMLGIKYKWL
ncbi:TPA: hypothetical protein ACXJEZ_003493 [Providencia rettgeri]